MNPPPKHYMCNRHKSNSVATLTFPATRYQFNDTSQDEWLGWPVVGPWDTSMGLFDCRSGLFLTTSIRLYAGAYVIKRTLSMTPSAMLVV